MSISLIAFTGFAIATSATPGPNNIMLAANTARFGPRAVLSMFWGIQLGFGSMLLAMGFGLALPLMEYPMLQSGMRWLGIAWLLYLAWKIGSAPAADPSAAGHERPALGLLGAAAIQIVNPKAWLMCVAIATSWISPDEPVAPQVLATTAIMILVCIPASLLWVGIGAGTARILGTPRRLRLFNIVMALLLVASVLPMAFS